MPHLDITIKTRTYPLAYTDFQDAGPSKVVFLWPALPFYATICSAFVEVTTPFLGPTAGYFKNLGVSVGVNAGPFDNFQQRLPSGTTGYKTLRGDWIKTKYVTLIAQGIGVRMDTQDMGTTLNDLEQGTLLVRIAYGTWLETG